MADDHDGPAETFLEAAAKARERALKPTAACRSCRAPIVWLTHASSGRAMPFNPVPAAGGRWRVFARDGVMVAAHDPSATFGYVSHFATCPNAGAYRRWDQ